MRNIIKLTTVFFLLFTSFASAMKYTPDVNKIAKVYLIGLNHDNKGVVESAIKNVIFLKINFPQYEFSKLEDKLEDLTLKGATKTIRLKAMIANDFLKNYEDYSWIQKGDYQNGDEIFNVYLNLVSPTISANF